MSSTAAVGLDRLDHWSTVRQAQRVLNDADLDRGRRRHRGGLRLLGRRRLERGLLEAGVRAAGAGAAAAAAPNEARIEPKPCRGLPPFRRERSSHRVFPPLDEPDEPHRIADRARDRRSGGRHIRPLSRARPASSRGRSRDRSRRQVHSGCAPTTCSMLLRETAMWLVTAIALVPGRRACDQGRVAARPSSRCRAAPSCSC